MVGIAAVVLALPAAAAARSGPACVPTSVDASALEDGQVTLSPLPGSRDASPRTQISFLGVPAGEIADVHVSGSRSGAHSGHMYAYSQGDGASFMPVRPFEEGESVTVSATLESAGSPPQPLTDSFIVATQDQITTTPRSVHAGSQREVQTFRSRADLRPPLVTVSADTPSASPGDLFLAPYAGPGQAGPMILESGGGLLWFKSLPSGRFAADLQVQQYDGQPVLTWWQGDISVHGFGLGEDVIYNQRYQQIARIAGGNGHQADLHELQLTPSGVALITAYYPILCNLSAVHGQALSGLIDSTFQEIDVRTGLVMYEWTSVDHLPLSQSYERPNHESVELPDDFFHLNSISQDSDGSLLVSGRNTWAIYDLNAQSGQINWRLGGMDSTFGSESDVRTAFQHDSRQLPDGDFSIFDNGASPKVHSQSRAIVVNLNPETKQATLVSQFEQHSPLISESQGDVQALANGNWFVGWGQAPLLSEFSPQGELTFEAHLPSFEQSYRSYRFAWAGHPAQRPAESTRFSAGSGIVYASWNGASEVASWRVLAGSARGSLHILASAPRSGFETAIRVPASARAGDLAVQALSATGAVLGESSRQRS